LLAPLTGDLDGHTTTPVRGCCGMWQSYSTRVSKKLHADITTNLKFESNCVYNYTENTFPEKLSY